MKFALLITQNCNLACRYCYINKRKIKLDLHLAEKAVHFVYENSSPGEKICIGFFGGEPLLEFERMKAITCMIEAHPSFTGREVEIQVTTNGTIFNDEIAGFLNEHNIGLGISCDGIPEVQNLNRRFTDGKPSSGHVGSNIIKALNSVKGVMVNSVFTPSTFRLLPRSIRYLYSLGLRRIFINPDFSARWTNSEAEVLQQVYNEVAEIYIDWHLKDDPAFISLIDGKIIVMLNGGYRIEERCHMGRKEFAISPGGNIFPCERLLGDGSRNSHCIGTLESGVDYKKFCHSAHFRKPQVSSCHSCTLKKYCMNWCGCSNYFSTGSYNQTGPFICASEKAAINSAFLAYRELENRYGAGLIERLAGSPVKVATQS